MAEGDGQSGARWPAWMVDGEVPRRRWGDPVAAARIASRQPVVLTGCPLVALLRLDFASLAELCGDHELGVHSTPSSTPVFARHYGRGLGVGTIEPMTFARFAAAAVAAERAQPPTGAAAASIASPRRNYYLQAPLRWHDDQTGKPRWAPLPALQRELERAVDWAWLDRACAAAGAAPFAACQLWAGHGGGSTPCHFDAQDNFFAQLAGRKAVLLLPPAQAWRLYPYPVGHVKDNFALADLEAADLARFPALAHARGAEATLGPGDVLYLPRYHWHQVPLVHTIGLSRTVGS